VLESAQQQGTSYQYWSYHVASSSVPARLHLGFPSRIHTEKPSPKFFGETYLLLAELNRSITVKLRSILTVQDGLVLKKLNLVNVA
jgi:hypothetical protein